MKLWGTRELRIAHVCPFVDEQMGGSERYVCTLSKAQSKEHDVQIFTTTRLFGRTGMCEDEGISVHRSYAPLTIWNINPLTFMLPALMKSECDVFHVHSHLYLTSNQAIFTKFMKKKKALLHLHGGVGTPPFRVSLPKMAAKKIYNSTLGKYTIRNSDLIASVSLSDLEKIALQYNLPQKRLRYIPNVVDTNKFKPRKNDNHDEKVLLFIGDLEPWKGIGSLISWVQNINWNENPFRLRIVGQGSYLPKLMVLQRKISKKMNGISLEVLGPRNHSEIPRILNDSNALILPSYWEGMPTVILEAMASGIPVISTRVGDIPNHIQHLKTGFLIDRSFESFTNAVSQVLDNSSVIKRISINARKLIEAKFCIHQVTKEVSTIYAKLSG